MKLLIRLLLLVLTFQLTQAANAQSVIERLVTPGPLSSAHAKLESKCMSCHADFSHGAQKSKCLSCHIPVANDINSRAGFHGKSSARNQQCNICHAEHRGRNVAIAPFTKAKFNHNLTDYPLRGKHATVACASCHNSGGKYRNASTSCASCHKTKEPHLGRLGTSCQNCHTETAWKPIKAFNHSSTGFSLNGRHSAVACMSCHVGQRWNGTPSTCVSCHAKNDKHNGTRGTNCAQCHNTASWRGASFDHNSMTRFDLTGQHRAVGCEGCHGANNRIKKPSMTCISCHANDDKHKGTRGTNCAECHSSAGWQATSFNHNKDTAFPLIGKHNVVRCAECHGQGNSIPKPPKTCYGCHQKDDSHKGNNGRNCQDCHNSTDWNKTSFDHDSMTRFALKGAHKEIECNACHKQPAKEVKPPMECVGCHLEDDPHKQKMGTECGSCHDVVKWDQDVRFDHDLTRFPLIGKHTPLECISCHEDKTFVAKGIACVSCHADEHHEGRLGRLPNCATCHNAVDWKRWKFDHDKQTDFTLTGKHKGLICSACHALATDPSKSATDCGSCHARDDIHRGNFGNNCARCHSTETFRGATLR
jgi:hypothetical protein